jgi:hypothetical protein
MKLTSMNARAASIFSAALVMAATLTASAASLTITNVKGQPLSDARVMIGMHENVPFPGNILTTDAQGQVQIPAQWTDAQAVTIDANGYVLATFFARLPQDATLAVNETPSNSRYELHGKTTNFSGMDSSYGYGHVGLIYPAVSRSKAATFQLSNVISPISDTISIMGKHVEVPSNLTFPSQTVTYILPIHLDKPDYRFYLPESRNWKMVASHLKFPVQKVVDEIRGGKSIFDVLNDFELVEASVKDVNVGRGSTSRSLPVNEIDFGHSVSLTAPGFDSHFNMLTFSMAENSGLFYMTDLKRLMPHGKMRLNTVSNNTRGILISVLTRADQKISADFAMMRPTTGAQIEEASVVITPANRSQAFEFLPIVRPPQLRGKTLVLAPPAHSVSGIDATLTYAALSKVEIAGSGKLKLEKKTPQWELYATDWASSLELPDMPVTRRHLDMTDYSAPMRWEALFGGQPTGAPKAAVGPDTLEKVSHVTRSAVDL